MATLCCVVPFPSRVVPSYLQVLSAVLLLFLLLFIVYRALLQCLYRGVNSVLFLAALLPPSLTHSPLYMCSAIF